MGLPCKEPCAKSPDKAQGLVLPTPLQKLRFLWASPARSLVPRTLTRHKGWFCQHRYQNDYMLCSLAKLYTSKTQQINIPGLSWQRRSPVLPDLYAVCYITSTFPPFHSSSLRPCQAQLLHHVDAVLGEFTIASFQSTNHTTLQALHACTGTLRACDTFDNLDE